MIESPTAVVLEPVPSAENESKDSNKGASQTELDLVVVKQTPITSSLRKATLYLREKAGRRSRFRGISIWLVYHFVFARLTHLISLIRFIPMGVDAILAAVALASLRMAWTHTVITEPSEKYWFKRLPSIKLWRKIALPTAIASFCEQAAVALPMVWFLIFGLSDLGSKPIEQMDKATCKLVIFKLLVVALLGIFCSIAIVIPAVVSLTRVQASLITEEDETIVPFDRSFGGRVIPTTLGGTGVVGMLDAWKTFDWNSRIRLLKLYVKVMAMEVAVIFAFAVAFSLQIYYTVGKENAWKLVEAIRGY
jgi:hypothetical protein